MKVPAISVGARAFRVLRREKSGNVILDIHGGAVVVSVAIHPDEAVRLGRFLVEASAPPAPPGPRRL